MSPPSYRPPGGGAAGLELDEVASYPRFVQKKGESYMDNFSEENAKGISLATEFLSVSYQLM